MTRLLKMQEAADFLRTPVATLRYWRHIGTGPPSLKLEKQVLYPEDGLKAYVEQKMAEASKA
jgi:hypothetical protein